MRVFIKSGDTFTTKVHLPLLDYDIKESIYDTVSTITTTADGNTAAEGDFLYIQELPFLGIIKSISIDENEAVISCEQMNRLFDRDILFAITPQMSEFDGVEQYVKHLIDTYYTNLSDNTYKMPFLFVTTETTTTGTALPDIENNVYVLASYLSKIRRLYGIIAEYSVSGDTLCVNIVKREYPTRKVDFSNPNYILDEHTFSSDIIGKITTYCQETTEQQNWFYMDDGTYYSTAATAGPLWALNHQDLYFEKVPISGNWQHMNTPKFKGYHYYYDFSLRGVTSNHSAELSVWSEDGETTDLSKDSPYCPVVITSANKVRIFCRIDGSVLPIRYLNINCKLKR